MTNVRTTMSKIGSIFLTLNRGLKHLFKIIGAYISIVVKRIVESIVPNGDQTVVQNRCGLGRCVQNIFFFFF